MPACLSRKNILKVAVVALITVPGLSACSLDTKTQLVSERIQLQQGASETLYERGALTASKMAAIRDDYNRFGNGPVKVAVNYDPKARKNTAMAAADEAARIGEGLRNAGVLNVETSLVPVHGLGEDMMISLAYDTTTAHAPEGCELMAGIEGKPTVINDEYNYGCSTQMLLARQIYRPSDLAGNDTRPEVSGRRRVNVAEDYAAGVPNDALDNTMSAVSN